MATHFQHPVLIALVRRLESLVVSATTKIIDLSNRFREVCVRVITFGAGAHLSDAQAELLRCRKAAWCDTDWVPGREAPTCPHMPP